MTEWRTALGCGFVEVAEAARGLPRELQQGRSVGLLMDQRYDRGAPVPFFGIPAPTDWSNGPAESTSRGPIAEAA